MDGGGEAVGVEDSADDFEHEVAQSGEFPMQDDAGGVQQRDDCRQCGSDAFADLAGDEERGLVRSGAFGELCDGEVGGGQCGSHAAFQGFSDSSVDAPEARDGLKAAAVSALAWRPLRLYDEVPDFHS